MRLKQIAVGCLVLFSLFLIWASSEPVPSAPGNAFLMGPAVSADTTLSPDILALQVEYSNFSVTISADTPAPNAQATPEEFFLTIWRETARTIYDPSELGDWSRWLRRFSGQLHSQKEALAAVDEMLQSVPDYYHHIIQKSSSTAVLPADDSTDANAAILLNNEVGYFKLDFSGSTQPAIDALTKLQNARALIIDVRNNPGGQVKNAVQLVSLFMESGNIATFNDRIPGDPAHPQYESLTYQANDNTVVEVHGDGHQIDIGRLPYMLNHRPVIILTSSQTASAAELFTAALQDNHIALVFGETTFGKGVGGLILETPNQTQLWLITFHFLTPSGKWLGAAVAGKQFGIEPDRKIAAPSNESDFGTANDNQLWEAWTTLVHALSIDCPPSIALHRFPPSITQYIRPAPTLPYFLTTYFAENKLLKQIRLSQKHTNKCRF